MRPTEVAEVLAELEACVAQELSGSINCLSSALKTSHALLRYMTLSARGAYCCEVILSPFVHERAVSTNKDWKAGV